MAGDRAVPGEGGFLVVGRVLAPWGIRGEIKIQVLTDFPQRFTPKARVCIDGTAVEIQRCRFHRGQAILKLATIETRDQAEALRGRLLQIPGSERMPLEADQYYVHQIVGLEVRTTEGQLLGPVTEVLRTGSNDVYVVRAGQREYLIPAIADVVQEVDLSLGRITIQALPGLLE